MVIVSSVPNESEIPLAMSLIGNAEVNESKGTKPLWYAKRIPSEVTKGRVADSEIFRSDIPQSLIMLSFR